MLIRMIAIFAFAIIATQAYAKRPEGKKYAPDVRRYASVEFKIDELVAGLNHIGRRAKLVLNNFKPKNGEEVDGSYFEFNGKKLPFQIRPIRKKMEGFFERFGAGLVTGKTSFVFYINQVELDSLGFAAAGKDGFDVEAHFSEKGAEIQSNSENVPNVNWLRPVVRARIKPQLHDGRVVLAVKQVRVGGRFEPECAQAWGARCQIAKAASEGKYAEINSEIESAVGLFFRSDLFNDMISDGIASALNFGAFGRIQIMSIEVLGDKLALKYCAYHC